MLNYHAPSSRGRLYLAIAAILSLFLITGTSYHMVRHPETARLLPGGDVLSSALSWKRQSDTLIFYVYYEEPSENALENSRFFIDHALHDSADFIFILQGPSPKFEALIPSRPNIRIIQRPNTCMDLGAYGEVLRAEPGLISKYKKFLFINASVRGPFMPHWSRTCWTSAFTDLLTPTTKVVGMSGHCMWGISQIQSMIIVTDRDGLRAILENNSFSCTPDEAGAIQNEIHLAQKLWRKQHYKSDVLLTAVHGDPLYANNSRQCIEDDNTRDHFNLDAYNGYFDFQVPYYETIFTKANRKIMPHMLDKYTEWHDRIGYSSYDYC